MPNTHILNSPRPRNWNQKTLASYLGGTPKELSELKNALTHLMQTHGKLKQTFKSIAMRTELKNFLESNLRILPPFVQDATSNATRMDGLMGMAYKIKNEYVQQSREKRDSFVEMATTSDNSDSNDNEEPEESEPPSQQQPQSQPQIVVKEGPNSNNNNNTQQNAPEPANYNHNHNNHNRTSGEGSAAAMEESHPAEPPSKRNKISPRPPGPDILARNIWVLNEIDHTKHGLCSIQELLRNEDPRNPNPAPQLADLGYDHWINIVQAHCGYDFTVHRLEYRPPANINIIIQPRRLPITVPMFTQSQWRGAMNSQLQTNPTQDPVFYMVYQCKSRASFDTRV
ncbi:hypothetical protein AWENTII_005833 [Aspergillus wentii]